MFKNKMSFLLTVVFFGAAFFHAAQTFGQTCTPPPSGLVAWLPGDGNANDISGNGNNGTLQSGVTYAVGKVAQAFNLDGTANGFIKVNASSSLNVGAGNGLTIEAWIRPTQISTAQILVEWNNGSNIGAHIALSSTIGGPSPGNVSANLIDTSGTFHFFESAGGLTTANAYQHVAVTYDKTTGIANLFLNGAVVATQNLGIFTPQTSYDLYLGKRISDGNYIFSGGLDETSIYNRALAQSEIQAIVNAGSAGKCKNAPTAAAVSVSGRVATTAGRGISRALVSATDGRGNVSTTSTNSFGFYSFAELPAGDTYIFSVRAKRYQFAQPSQVLSVVEDQTDVNFTAFPAQRDFR